MDFLIQNWYLIVAVVAVLAAIGFSVYKFAGLPTAEQKEKIMAWAALCGYKSRGRVWFRNRSS